MSSVPAVLLSAPSAAPCGMSPPLTWAPPSLPRPCKRGNVKGEWLDEVMFGNVLSAAQGQNVARQCMVKAGVPLKVPAYTVSMVCGSGLKSVIEGARAIQCGDADLVMCGGTESMTGAPYAIPTNRWGARMGHTQIQLTP